MNPAALSQIRLSWLTLLLSLSTLSMERNMSKITLSIGIVAALGILATALAARAPVLELDSCHDDLAPVYEI